MKKKRNVKYLCVLCLILTCVLGGCAPKKEELINDAFPAEMFLNNEETFKQNLMMAQNKSFSLNVIGGFEYNTRDTSYADTFGANVNVNYQSSGMKENGVDMAVTGDVQLKIPDIVLLFMSQDIPMQIPISVYAQVDKDMNNATIYMNEGTLGGDDGRWQYMDTDVMNLLKGKNDAAEAEEIASLVRNCLIQHSTVGKEIEYEGQKVYDVSFQTKLSDEDTYKIVRYLLGIKTDTPMDTLSGEGIEITDAVKDEIILEGNYYITKDDHEFVYAKIDFSKTDLNKVLYALAKDKSKLNTEDMNLILNTGYVEIKNLSTDGVKVEVPKDLKNNATNVGVF